MIAYLGCSAARQMLEAFVDLELPVEEQVVLESHLRWCKTCEARVADVRLIGAALRSRAASPVPAESDASVLASIQSEVLTKVRAERDQSWPVRFRELFVDLRYFWPAIGATGALAACLLIAASVSSFMRAEQPNSIADRISALANPGSDRNPLPLDSWMLAPRSLNEGPVLDAIPDEEAVFAFAAVVTREGRVANYELLQPIRLGRARHGTAADSNAVLAILDAVRNSRFTPAQTSAGAVAVNLVWLLARTTVKASAEPFIDPPRPAPRPARS